jgi:hypothetical protein
MLPQNHFAVAVVVTAVVIVGLVPGMVGDLVDDPASGIWPVLAWVVLAGSVAALIDLDVMVIVRRASREDPDLERWTRYSSISGDFKGFIEALSTRGLLRRVAVTHLASAVAATVLAYLVVPGYAVSVAIGAWSHLATDVPYIWRHG